ncbi:MAG: anti-sigma factor [Pantoea sp.]|uniref:anti-sigma factor family protein n=1 Tax=Pantoea sp. TaxID=69393 RepID=UPI00239B5D60|nr:anti-sigma factor [Pantoea sp.]MDE1186873.1 anti-sigma factor [Pantoea sp.]
MTDTDALVTDDELHAFVDGQLDAARVAAVLQHLQRHPEAAVRAAQWHAQRLALRRLRRAADPGPTPDALTQTVLRHRRSRWNPWTQAAAALLLVVAGAAGTRAWQAATAPAAATAAATAPQFVQDATTAYAVYAPEVRHPVEVTAQEEAHLVQWLSRRLGRPLVAPDLQSQGFHLLGGRLLPGEPAGAVASAAAAGDAAGNPAARAQFMYEDTHGRRVTLYVAVFPPEVAPHGTAFRSVASTGGVAFYWVDNGYGYALNGDLPAAELQHLAGGVYDQLFPR